jgi:trk system potassium uptake protein TrkA
MARRMGARQVITKVNKFSYFPVMLAIGLEQVVNTRLSAINTILQFIREGKVLSAVSLKDEQAEVLEAIAMGTSDIVDKPIHKVGFPKGSLVAAIFRNDQVIIPTGDSVITEGDRVIIFAHRRTIPKIEKRLAVKLEYF